MRTTWHECTLADLLARPWRETLFAHVDGERERAYPHPAPWRLWCTYAPKPSAPPIVVVTSLSLVSGERCAAFLDVEVAMLFVAAEDGGADARLLADLARARRAKLEAGGEPKRLVWGDVCAHSDARWQRRAARSQRSLGVALASVGLAAVRVEVQGADERSEARAA